MVVVCSAAGHVLLARRALLELPQARDAAGARSGQGASSARPRATAAAATAAAATRVVIVSALNELGGR